MFDAMRTEVACVLFLGSVRLRLSWQPTLRPTEELDSGCMQMYAWDASTETSQACACQVDNVCKHTWDMRTQIHVGSSA